MIKTNPNVNPSNNEDKTAKDSCLSLNEGSNKKISSMLKKPELTDKIYVSNIGREKTIEIHRVKREPNIEVKKVGLLKFLNLY